MLNIAVLISGGGSNLQSIIDGCESGYINGIVKLVISNKDNAYGLERAIKHNIKTFVEKEDEKIIDLLNKENIDLVVLAGYLKIISPKFVEAFRNKIINIHPSLIPAFCGEGYYGKRVHESVINYGAKLSGATVHFVDEGADTGPIIMQKSVEVKFNDTPQSLSERVLTVEHEILKESVKLYCDNKLTVNGRGVIVND
ncbi:phosphoribosylglycinamide formyltransferase [[Clostridium] bifermentans ATCC 638]|uniref:Phosphoribosylglycinamide formyltransferase n=1 Tax=Paraclostridium bifermentans ATCC 638 = DSM 14991 TaxID=1233171 RepID=T4VXH6_PARBF|nr:phosphoribosylglycinamide formyltransferase [Paraclostridium bifermentans]EQK45531.1 phosphoribosylglycinamide formyltransferase [[Clostridium] bifermentans ATCC 638] [Paraclostridium bifermentans ATCC 638 = DSM 14991]RIZ57536.1 phosphoribosylglycinamide formyltransferase [Paraclostridium bifermentans]UAG18010.1 phosphoribosylglycinamide formyltransferase [Paraclostridium bifermentans]